MDSKAVSSLDGNVSLVDAVVYHNENSALWISSWSSEGAAVKFENSILRTQDDSMHLIRVERDYGMGNRKEAPPAAPEGADAAQDASLQK